MRRADGPPLLQRRIDFPIPYQAEAASFSNFGPITRYVQDYLFTTVNVDGQWAARNGPALAAFLRGLRRGLAAMRDEPETAVATAARELDTTPALAQRALGDTAKLEILSRDLSVSERALKGTFDTLFGVGLLPPGTPFEPGRVVDMQYLGKAN